jgi:hypothetical protein
MMVEKILLSFGIYLNEFYHKRSECYSEFLNGSFGNYDFKNKYDSIFAFFFQKKKKKKKKKKIIFYSTFSKINNILFNFLNKSYFIQLFLILFHKVKRRNSRTK